MKLATIDIRDSIRHQAERRSVEKPALRAGASPDCDIRLRGATIASHHATFVHRDDQWRVLPSGTAAIRVGDEVIDRETIVEPDTPVWIGHFILRFMPVADDAPNDDLAPIRKLHELQASTHAELLRQLDLRRDRPDPETVVRELDRILESKVAVELADPEFRPALRRRAIGARLAQRAAARLESSAPEAASGAIIETPAEKALRERRQALRVASDLILSPMDEEQVERIMQSLEAGLPPDAIRWQVGVESDAEIDARLAQIPSHLDAYLVTSFLKRALLDTVYGLGPLQELLDLPGVNEIMVVHPTCVYVEAGGSIIRTHHSFLSNELLLNALERMLADIGRRIDRSEPMVDGYLADKTRIHAVIPPIATEGACLTIRRQSFTPLREPELIARRSLTPVSVRLLEAMVRDRANIIVSGGTSSGKTSLLGFLSSFIGAQERVVTIEDTVELCLRQEHVIPLVSRPPSLQKTGEITIRDLVRTSLRMRPDRIIVGEVRDGAAFDMLQAMNTGHDGSMTTIHANGAEHVIERLTGLIAQAVTLPLPLVHRMIAAALDVIVQVERRIDEGRRLVAEIVEVDGVDPTTGRVRLRPLLLADPDELGAVLEPTGRISRRMPRLVDRGLLDLDGWLDQLEVDQTSEIEV